MGPQPPPPIFSLSMDSRGSTADEEKKIPPDAMSLSTTASTSTVSTDKSTANIVKDKDSSDESSSGFNLRYAIIVLSMGALSSLTANVICFNFAVLCMPGTDEPDNAAHNYTGYTKHEQTVLLSSPAVGALVSVVPVSHAIHAFGLRKVFYAAGLASTLATVAVPIASRTGFTYFVALRFIQGMSTAVIFPSVGAVTASWAALTQHGLFMSTLTTFGQISAIFAMPVAGYLCVSSFGYAAVFYVHAVLSGIIFTAWFAVYRNEPAKHPFIRKSEVNEIHRGKSCADLEKYDESGRRKTIPYLSIVTTPAVWAIWMGALGDMIAVQLLHIFSPKYMHEALGYSIKKTGWAATLPVLFQFLFKVFAGHTSDRIKCISETTKLRIYNTLALGLAGVFMFALAFVPSSHPVWGVVLMTASNAMFGFNGGGFNKCASLVSRQYSHFVMANIQVIMCLSMLISPILVNAILVEGTMFEWKIIFISHAAILLVTNAIFCLLATAKAAEWTLPDEPQLNTRNQSVLKKLAVLVILIFEFMMFILCACFPETLGKQIMDILAYVQMSIPGHNEAFSISVSFIISNFFVFTSFLLMLLEVHTAYQCYVVFTSDEDEVRDRARTRLASILPSIDTMEIVDETKPPLSSHEPPTSERSTTKTNVGYLESSRKEKYKTVQSAPSSAKSVASTDVSLRRPSVLSFTGFCLQLAHFILTKPYSPATSFSLQASRKMTI